MLFVGLILQTTQTQNEVQQEHLYFDLLGVLGDIETRHAGFLKSGLLVVNLENKDYKFNPTLGIQRVSTF